MKAKLALALWFCSIGFFPIVAQNQLFIDAFDEFSASRLWEFEEIPIDWKMEGMLQAVLNKGLSRSLTTFSAH